MNELDNMPKDWQAALFSLFRAIMPSSVRKLFTLFFFNISPDIPYDLSKRIKERNYWQTILYGTVIGFIFCFLTTAGFCFYEKVLFPYQCELPQCTNMVFFSKDWVNIIMYTIITPATTGIGMALFLATILTWKNMDELLTRERSALISRMGIIITSMIIIVSSLAISNYINDIVNTKNAIGIKANEYHYWFLGSPTDNSLIKPITVYYTILNFLILVFTLACIAMFVTGIRPILVLSHLISTGNISLEDNKEDLIEKIAPFADVYLFAKILLFITMIHSYVWSYSPLAGTGNFNIERGFIVVVGVFFITVPRLYFELEWYRSAISYKQRGVAIDLKPDYLSHVYSYVIGFVDFALIGGYIISLTGASFGPFAKSFFG